MPKPRERRVIGSTLLYDKVYRADVLGSCLRMLPGQDGGRPGVDGQTFDDIRSTASGAGWVNWRKNSGNRRYHPQAVRRVWIPKPDGKQRPLGIPTIKDRVVQMAALLVLEPIFEADLQPEQYAYRPGRSALGRRCSRSRRCLKAGHTEVLDADLSGYFDSIPHAEVNEIGGPSRQRPARAGIC